MLFVLNDVTVFSREINQSMANTEWDSLGAFISRDSGRSLTMISEIKIASGQESLHFLQSLSRATKETLTIALE